MTVLTAITLIRYLLMAAQIAKEAYDSLTPEEKAMLDQKYESWQQDIRDMQLPGDLNGLEGP